MSVSLDDFKAWLFRKATLRARAREFESLVDELKRVGEETKEKMEVACGIEKTLLRLLSMKIRFELVEAEYDIESARRKVSDEPSIVTKLALLVSALMFTALLPVEFYYLFLKGY